jgi:eukaryotic-like serine/threonine-protein kinase
VTPQETLELAARARAPVPARPEETPEEAIRPGLLLDGRYLLQALLDEGGASSVWRAENVRIGRAVAVKILRPEVAHSPRDVERFRREAQIAVRLSSPHVVDVLDFGDAPGGALYLVMELLAGVSLRERLRRDERLPPARVTELLRQLLAGLDAAHRAGIVHRDLKPDNLWLVPLPDGEERLKILDFGIAKLAEPSPPTERDQAGFVVGTPQFLSPEQAVGAEVDHRADLYSAGIIAWLLATGRHPFPTHDPLTLLRAHAYEPVPSPADEWPSLASHPALLRFIARATEKDRDRRAQSAAELIEVLEGRDASAPPAPAPLGPALPLPLRAALAAAVRSGLVRAAAGVALAAALALSWATLRPPPDRLIADGRVADAEDRIDALAARRGPTDPEVLYLGGLLEAARAERDAPERLPHAFIAWSRALAAGSPGALSALEREAQSERCDRRRLAARALGDSGALAGLEPLRAIADAEPPLPEPDGALARVMREVDPRCGAGDLARRAIHELEAARR